MSLLSTREVARQLGIPHYTLEYLITTGAVKDAHQRVAGKRAWTPVEVVDLQLAIAARHAARKDNAAKETEGDE